MGDDDSKHSLASLARKLQSFEADGIALRTNTLTC